MSRQVKIKARAGETICFPAQCVHCAKPAPERLRLRKRIGRITRLIDVPLCAECAHEVHRLSGEEERWQQLSWLLAGLVWLATLALLLLLLPGAFSLPIRFSFATIAALAAAVAAFRYGRHLALQRARPEKKAVLEAVRITDFSWRATTFVFANDAFAERFVAVNHKHLLGAP